MKKYLTAVAIGISLPAFNAYGLGVFSCPCPDGSSVQTGEYCPGSSTPCGSGIGGGGGGGGDDCDGTCSNCLSSNWLGTFTAGYQVRTVATCNTQTCVCTKQTFYRCAVGYYGSSTDGKSGCTQCPSSGGIAGQSIAGSNTSITDCYIPANTSMTDSTGTYTYTSNCYYSN